MSTRRRPGRVGRADQSSPVARGGEHGGADRGRSGRPVGGRASGHRGRPVVAGQDLEPAAARPRPARWRPARRSRGPSGARIGVDAAGQVLGPRLRSRRGRGRRARARSLTPTSSTSTSSRHHGARAPPSQGRPRRSRVRPGARRRPAAPASSTSCPVQLAQPGEQRPGRGQAALDQPARQLRPRGGGQPGGIGSGRDDTGRGHVGRRAPRDHRDGGGRPAADHLAGPVAGADHHRRCRAAGRARRPPRRSACRSRSSDGTIGAKRSGVRAPTSSAISSPSRS